MVSSAIIKGIIPLVDEAEWDGMFLIALFLTLGESRLRRNISPSPPRSPRQPPPLAGWSGGVTEWEIFPNWSQAFF